MADLTGAFATMMRDRQFAWALGGGIPTAALEERHGRVSWVLKPEHRKLNLFCPDWWDYIAGSEHRWARALNSSQCFAVNLFAPLAEDPARARAALEILLPTRALGAQDSVAVQFEFTPEGAPEWLGEHGQPTQIDVYFRITRLGRCIGHVLIEVKFSETSFGCCRGWEAKPGDPSANPDRSRCLDASAILSAPQANCWMAQFEGRRYWEIISEPESSIRIEAIRSASACPFRHGLYQMMRNRVLADELMRRTGAAWADFAVCRHPLNQAVLALDEPVASTRNAIEAFRSLSSGDAVRDWNAEEVLATIRSIDDRLAGWETWMRARYFS
jgi:restriction endonuclease-like protein